MEISVIRDLPSFRNAATAATKNQSKYSSSGSNAGMGTLRIFMRPVARCRQPGLINHMFKAAATYRFDMGLELGGFYRWNSGLWLSETFSASRRHLPARTDKVGMPPSTYAGITRHLIAPGAVGAVDNPSWGQLDLRRVKCTRRVGRVHI